MAKAARNKPSNKRGTKKNKLRVKYSLVNTINARNKKETFQSKKKSSISQKSYEKMENNWREE